MSRREVRILTALLGILIVAGLFWQWVGKPAPEERSPGEVTLKGTESLAARMQSLPAALSAADDFDRRAEVLTRTARELELVTKDEAVSILRAMLDRGVDAATGLAFKIGPGGNLIGSPTLRVWLLDLLGRLDPAAAADYAATIYARSRSADEWAIALRNDWRVAASQGKIEGPRARALELLHHEAWARDPSAGFLEAFDLCVASLAWEALPRFETWLAPGQPKALRTGAWIALDRLAMEGPTDFLPALSTHERWLATQPAMRAGLMARANVATPVERTAVETYLRRGDLAPAEGKRFLELFPNVSATVSYNLVTTARTPTPQFAALMDHAALTAVREWRGDVRFARWSTDLATAEERLRESVASAVRGGYLPP
jgi:hypothetical protein